VLDVVENRDKFFEETSKHYLDLLKEYSSKDAIDYFWKFTPVYNILGVMPDKSGDFKSIVENLDKVDGYTVLAIGISEFPADREKCPHTDTHPRDGRFKRYHLALQTTDTSFLYVKENGKDEWIGHPWDLGKWMEFEGIHHLHYPYNETKGISRIVILLDILEGEASNQDIYDYYSYIETLGWIVDKDFRHNYKDFIKKKEEKHEVDIS
jgi:hypothetical protein